MKLKFNNMDGELIPTPMGYFTTDSHGDIIFPDFIFMGQNFKEEVFVKPVTFFGDGTGELNIWPAGDLYNKLEYYHWTAYVEYECYHAGDTDRNLINRIIDKFKEAENRGIVISEFVRDYMENKEYEESIKYRFILKKHIL